jgi:hypothetical protein
MDGKFSRIGQVRKINTFRSNLKNIDILILTDRKKDSEEVKM